MSHEVADLVLGAPPSAFDRGEPGFISTDNGKVYPDPVGVMLTIYKARRNAEEGFN
jgi:hypothetical protein